MHMRLLTRLHGMYIVSRGTKFVVWILPVTRCERMLIGRLLLARTCGSGCTTPLGGPAAS